MRFRAVISKVLQGFIFARRNPFWGLTKMYYENIVPVKDRKL